MLNIAVEAQHILALAAYDALGSRSLVRGGHNCEAYFFSTRQCCARESSIQITVFPGCTHFVLFLFRDYPVRPGPRGFTWNYCSVEAQASFSNMLTAWHISSRLTDLLDSGQRVRSALSSLYLPSIELWAQCGNCVEPLCSFVSSGGARKGEPRCTVAGLELFSNARGCCICLNSIQSVRTT